MSFSVIFHLRHLFAFQCLCAIRIRAGVIYQIKEVLEILLDDNQFSTLGYNSTPLYGYYNTYICNIDLLFRQYICAAIEYIKLNLWLFRFCPITELISTRKIIILKYCIIIKYCYLLENLYICNDYVPDIYFCLYPLHFNYS